MPASFVWQPGPTGGTPANAANLNRLAVTADIGTAGTPTGDALKAAYGARSGSRAVGQDELTVNVKDHGVKGDAVYNSSGATIAAGGSTLTGSGFTQADAGKAVYVVGAGASGATLSTTISGFVDQTTVTLAAAASTAVANAAYIYGTDDTAAIQALLDGVSDGTYHDLLFPRSNYLTGGLNIKSNTRLRGAGRGGWAYTFPQRTTRLIAKPDMTTAGLLNDYNGTLGGNVYVSDLMLDGAKAFHASARAGIYLADSATSADSMWVMERLLVNQFSGDGVYLGAFRRANRLYDVHSWQCGGNGLTIVGSDNNITMSVFAQCGGDGVNIGQSTSHLYGCDIFSNTGCGVNIAALGRMTMLTNCSIDVNGRQGVLTAAKNTSLVQCRFTSNSQSADGTYADVEVSGGAQGCSLVNPIFYLASGVTNLPDVPLKAISNNNSNPVMLAGFSHDPSVTTWRHGSYVPDQVALLYKGFSLSDGSQIVLGTTAGTTFGTTATQKLAFYGKTPIVQPTVTGSRSGGAALVSLLGALAGLGIITDGTTA